MSAFLTNFWPAIAPNFDEEPQFSKGANLTTPDQEPAQALIAKLSPEGRRRYVDLILARDFSAFVTKVFETVSPGDVYLPNWHIDAMTYAAGRVMDGTIKRLITTVPPRHLKSIVFSVALPVERKTEPLSG